MRMVHKGLDINSLNYDGQTSLHLMAKGGFKKAIEMLLLEGNHTI
jgi:ankyrin repeat protein